MVGTFREPSGGRRNKPIHSIPYSVAQPFIDKAKRYTEIRELTPEILRLFISRIEVGEKSVKYSRTAEQAIRIVYRDVGIMDSVQPAEENGEHKNIA